MLCAHCAYSRMTKNAVKRLCLFTGERLAFGQRSGGCAGWLKGEWDEAKEKPDGGTPGHIKKNLAEEESMTQSAEKRNLLIAPCREGMERFGREKGRLMDESDAAIPAGRMKRAEPEKEEA